MLTKERRGVSDKTYLKLAIPFIFSTVTQPLLGAADTAVVGRLADPAYIAGVSVGAVIFNTMYWLFGFLRVSTTAYSAQAVGAGSLRAATGALVKPGVLAAVVGAAMCALQGPIFRASMAAIAPDADVMRHAGAYFGILIWGAPVVMMNYVMLGWLMGQEKIRVSLLMQIGGNLLNIGLDILFVRVFHLHVVGVAAATLISQLASFAVGALAVWKYCDFGAVRGSEAFRMRAVTGMLRQNADLMVRTVCVLIQINVFTSAGAALGTAVLSANAILYQIAMIVSYSFDGLANASSVFAGRARGSRDARMLRATWRVAFRWTAVLACVGSVLCLLGGKQAVAIFTDIPALLRLAGDYVVWTAVFPLAAGAGVSFYGIFTGVGDTGSVRNSTIGALLLFLVCWKIFLPLYGNHGLWLAFVSFYLGRSLLLMPYYRRTFEKLTMAKQGGA